MKGTRFGPLTLNGQLPDFHSEFIGMLRAHGIPARFDIGFPDKAEIPGYHCWADFYAPRTGWIPLDISEASQAKEKQDVFLQQC